MKKTTAVKRPMTDAAFKALEERYDELEGAIDAIGDIMDIETDPLFTAPVNAQIRKMQAILKTESQRLSKEYNAVERAIEDETERRRLRTPQHKDFKTFNAWCKAAMNAGLKTRKVSVSLSNGEYWQAYQEGTIVGYFLTGPSTGHLLTEVLL